MKTTGLYGSNYDRRGSNSDSPSASCKVGASTWLLLETGGGGRWCPALGPGRFNQDTTAASGIPRLSSTQPSQRPPNKSGVTVPRPGPYPAAAYDWLPTDGKSESTGRRQLVSPLRHRPVESGGAICPHMYSEELMWMCGAGTPNIIPYHT